jgi:hypothetical protein
MPMPEYVSVVNQRKTNDAGLKFSSTFRHSGIHGACPLSVGVRVRVYVWVCVCINAGMPVCPASDQSGTRMKNQWCRDRSGTGPNRQSPAFFLVRYRTKITDAGMPKPAFVSSVPMPSYDNYTSIYNATVLSIDCDNDDEWKFYSRKSLHWNSNIVTDSKPYSINKI